MLTTLTIVHERGHPTIRLGHVDVDQGSRTALVLDYTCHIRSLVLLPLRLVRPLLCIHRPHHILRLSLLRSQSLSCACHARVRVSVRALTDQRVDRLLCLPLQPGKLLLGLPLEIPVRPLRRNVEYVLLALSCAPCLCVFHPQAPVLAVVHPPR